MARILIIDDDLHICDVLLKFSEGLHHEALAAHTIADGLASAQNNNYDLVLLDLELPDGNGLQILPDLQGVSRSPR